MLPRAHGQPRKHKTLTKFGEIKGRQKLQAQLASNVCMKNLVRSGKYDQANIYMVIVTNRNLSHDNKSTFNGITETIKVRSATSNVDAVRSQPAWLTTWVTTEKSLILDNLSCKSLLAAHHTSDNGAAGMEEFGPWFAIINS